MSPTEIASLAERAGIWRSAAEKCLGWSPQAGSPGPGPFFSLAGRIEHTLLKAEATTADLKRLCREATRFGFRSVCCLPKDVALCKEILGGSGVLVVTVLDFPLAGASAAVLECECRSAVSDGADEVDLVAPLRALCEGDWPKAREQVARVVSIAGGRPVKVILETGLLSPEQIVFGAVAAEAGGARFVKTSTGFGPRGATLEDVAILKAAVGDRIGIKASGGIRDREFALRLIDAGADLLGTSHGPALV